PTRAPPAASTKDPDTLPVSSRRASTRPPWARTYVGVVGPSSGRPGRGGGHGGPTHRGGPSPGQGECGRDGARRRVRAGRRRGDRGAGGLGGDAGARGARCTGPVPGGAPGGHGRGARAVRGRFAAEGQVAAGRGGPPRRTVRWTCPATVPGQALRP